MSAKISSSELNVENCCIHIGCSTTEPSWNNNKCATFITCMSHVISWANQLFIQHHIMLKDIFWGVFIGAFFTFYSINLFFWIIFNLKYIDRVWLKPYIKVKVKSVSFEMLMASSKFIPTLKQTSLTAVNALPSTYWGK